MWELRIHSCTPQHIRLQIPVTANEIVAVRRDVLAAKRLRRTIIIAALPVLVKLSNSTLGMLPRHRSSDMRISLSRFFHLSSASSNCIFFGSQKCAYLHVSGVAPSPPPKHPPTLSSSWIIYRKRMFRQTEYFSKSSTPSIQYIGT